jgi:hypothetical protein
MLNIHLTGTSKTQLIDPISGNKVGSGGEPPVTPTAGMAAHPSIPPRRSPASIAIPAMKKC